MKQALSLRFWIEAGLAGLSGSSLALTLVWPDWFERFFGFEPDGGDGSAEWGLTLFLVVCTTAFVSLAWREWQAARPA
ncbi:MAG TPA: hypothetical protein VGP22_17835 [Albitalea sp.]|nr:hypothetical protein [Albitalea sp.]